jgi:asparagine synthase (glutamine-hydrolysing)
MDTAPNADERVYARAIARKTNTKLLEIPTSAELITNFDEMEIRGAFPSGWPLDINEHLEDDEALKLEGYAAEFYGHGGDELFARLSFMPAAADYAWVKGIGTRFLSLVLEDCRRNSSSFWRTAKIAFGHGVRKKPWHPKYMVLTNRNPLISQRIFRDAFKDPTHWHPLYQHPNHIQPAKYEQAFMLTFGLGAAHVGINTHYPLRTRSPLKSQPLLELCARIPLWLHQKGGVDRAVARTAFSEALPTEIRFRSSKAFGTQKYRDLVQMKQHLIRRTLLNGYLVSQGFVDAFALENAIGQEVPAVQAETLPLCDLMSVELWARKFA